ncbi:MAG: hypothetical protein JXA68_03045 [Ignavibacteriales bacterium]|nr:hypothetical protein [Ignavibacteriales bacterium]
MEIIEKKYIVNKKNKKIAVQLDLETFEKIENIMEDYALYHLMNENENDELLTLNEAKQYYSKLEKKS